MSNLVSVIDTNKQPCEPVLPGMARRLLNEGKAAVFRRYPFTIILKEERNQDPEPCQLKVDPGSKQLRSNRPRRPGLAIVQGNKVLWGAELEHRGQQIQNSLEYRRSLRRGRRGRKTRYGKPRFGNRTRPEGWLAPSLNHRVETTLTGANRLMRYCPICSIAMELVRFDTQAMQNPEISGTEYQQGTLYQYEVREYLLEKWNRTCAYCGAKDTPLEVEHIVPRSKGGSNRVSNLSTACVPCNKAKENRSIEEFLSGNYEVTAQGVPDLLKRIKAQAKAPLKDAAAVNSTRWKLFNSLKAIGLSVTVGTGGQTKWNRKQQGLPKAHWVDATAVGKDCSELEFCTSQPLLIKAMGHGCRRVIHVDKYGFPRRLALDELVRKSALVKQVKGFQTGDIVKAVVTSGKKIGTYVGRVAVRSCGSFNIKTLTGTVQGISHKYCSFVQRKDGYSYAFN